GGDVLQDIVRAEAAAALEIRLAVREPGRDRNWIRLVADVDHPHELAVPVVLLGSRLVGGDEIWTITDRPGGVGCAHKRRRPARVTEKLHVAQIAAIDHGNTATPERRKHSIAPDHRR